MYDTDAIDYVSFTGFLKAFPAEESGRRMLYCEAANEANDFQNETILAKALADSAPYYLRYGNVDVDHVTQIGAKQGIPNYNLYEIARPLDVKVDGTKVFVKAEVFQGEGPAAAMANEVWSGLTDIKPPQRWYPSVAGQIPQGSRVLVMDPETGSSKRIIKAVRWTNIGLSKTPVNPMVPTVGTVPMGILTKCWGPLGLDIEGAMLKDLTAGYGTDSATLTGGAALRKETTDRKVQSYWDFRDRLAGDLRRKAVGQSATAMHEHAVHHYGVDPDEASSFVDRFMGDLREGLKQRKTQ